MCILFPVSFFRMSYRSNLLAVSALLALSLVSSADAADLTPQQDHQRLVDSLHIASLRGGADGRNPNAPNAANYDEAKANPFPNLLPNLPDPLIFKNGQRVTSSKESWELQRPEIVEDFDREIYGRLPASVLAKAWGYASLNATSIQPDSGAWPAQGIIGLANKGQLRQLDDWGALRAWVWGASRALDYFETDKAVDAKHVAIAGHSRYGKAALVAMAYDRRFAAGYISSSGESGAKLHRRNWGELVENVAGTGDCMAANFLKCAGWVGAKDMFMAASAAGPVYQLLGKKGVGTNVFPPIETALTGGEIASRQHTGGHAPAPNWPILLTFAARYLPAAQSATEQRWALDADGGITWTVQPGTAHEDQIEMSGRKVSLIATYGVDAEGHLVLRRQIVFPLLRTLPNDTHASLSYSFGNDAKPRILIDGRPTDTETVRSFSHKGILTVRSIVGRQQKVSLTRALSPSTTKQLVIERLTFTNTSAKTVSLEVERTEKIARTNPRLGVYGEYVIAARVLDAGEREIAPGESTTFHLTFNGRKADERESLIDADAEEQARKALVDSYLSKLVLETPDAVLNRAFAFAKIRTAESVYETKGGLMHGPGGGSYYAAIWANDQAEYANPLFPFLGDATADASAVNAFRLFATYMNPDYKPIPSSIIAEGTSFWNGAGDRGDMAMIAYGAARFALAYGDRKTAVQLRPLIEWCLEYCRRKMNSDGVIASDSDELEGRFSAGKANLNTSSLYYDALNSAAMLDKELGGGKEVDYAERAKQIRAAIEQYFGAEVEGFHTYRYYDGNTVLRAWICTPLTVGIFDRASGTVEALFSPRLWTPDGVATQAGEKTFWDRASLYALRGALAAGETQRALAFLTYYSNRRLLGEHVPYPVEAWPEGNQRHLAAESALYCRIYTEGLFGMRPTGLRSFDLTPRLPPERNEMKLKSVQAFGQSFDVEVSRARDRLRIEVKAMGRKAISQEIASGGSTTIRFD
jgi:hypothetical protein